MRKVYLPDLKKIKIQNFTLYPKGMNFEYDFINGVNLIIGGNGMGKTTLVNIIKYAVIGHYEEGHAFIGTYADKKIERRKNYSYDYYRRRQDNITTIKKLPRVIIEFEVNHDKFIVERNLSDIILESVIVNGEKIAGEVISQKKYDQIVSDNNKKSKDKEEIDLSSYLPHIYENMVEESTGITFDDLILFVNEVLFFGESHQTILWDSGKVDVQEELFNKFFNDPILDLKRQEAIRQTKYFDSLSRHASEDMRAIKKVLKENKNDENNDSNSISEQIISLRSDIEIVDGNLDRKYEERRKLDDTISLLNNEINTLTQKEGEIEKKKKIIENEILVEKWRTLHPEYYPYLDNLKINHECPICRQMLADDFVKAKINMPDNCFLCEQEIIKYDNENSANKFESLNDKMNSIYERINVSQRKIRAEEKSIKKLDSEYRSLVSRKRKLNSKLRNLEHLGQKEKNPVVEFQPFYDEIDRLQEKKEKYQAKSKLEQWKREEITLKINVQIQENTNKFSKLFAGYAGRFLGVDCSLTFTNSPNSKKKRYYPVIDGTIRYTEDEMSESQRFFIDHSFRMSILTFFYQRPTFYIVETPDSSLDISYERNAAEVFVKFLQNPNTLIITANFNNSEFLQHLISIADNVDYIDLLEIGKISVVQNRNLEMNSISSKIKNKIKNAKH